VRGRLVGLATVAQIHQFSIRRTLMSLSGTESIGPLSPLAITVADLSHVESMPSNGDFAANSPYPGVVAPERATVMIVDDEPINVDLLKLYLEEAGYEKFCVSYDSRDAVEIIRSKRPDVVLVDLMMPHVSGFDILTAVRTDPELRQTPVIILTASAGAESKLKALELKKQKWL